MISMPDMRDFTVCVSSFAKSYLCAGMKVGYITGPSEIIRALRHYYMLSSFTPNTAALRTRYRYPAAARRISSINGLGSGTRLRQKNNRGA